MSSRPWQSILVAVADPARRGQPAIRKAARLAAASRARVTLFHAFAAPYPPPEPMPEDPQAIIRAVRKAREAQLQKLARPLRAAGIKVNCEVAWDFPPAHAIVRRVLAGKPDLVIAESHRHTRLSRWLLANADWELIRECPCPVWFVKHERLGKRPLILAAVDPTHAHAKPSGLDDRLLAAAAAVAGRLDGSTALLHVEDAAQFAPLVYLPALPPGLGQLTPAARAATHRALGRLGRRHGVAPDQQHLRSGAPARVLPQAAAALRADLLVMGAVSRSALQQSFIGHTAEAVIDAVGCDVLVVKPRGFRSSVPRKGPVLGAKRGR